MKIFRKRAVSLLLTLCLTLSLCSPLSVWAVGTVAADTFADVVHYDLFYDDDTIDYGNSAGNVAISTIKTTLEARYKDGTIDFLPYTFGGSGSYHMISGRQATGSAYGLYDGLLLHNGRVGSYMAFKIRFPGTAATGTYELALNYVFVNTHSAMDYQVYLLPASTLATAVESNLTEGNLLGTLSVYSAGHTDGGTYTGVIASDFQATAGEEYLLVVKSGKDNAKDDKSRTDIRLAGLTFTKEDANPDLTYGGLPYQTAQKNAVGNTSFYKAINGVHPTTGNDLLYLLFKGGTLWVYDIDNNVVLNTLESEYLPSHPHDACFDKDNMLWICGSGGYLLRYDPTNNTLKRVSVTSGLQYNGADDPDGFVSMGDLFGITYYNQDGVERLYFGMASKAQLGYVEITREDDTVTYTPHRISGWLNSSTTLKPDGYYGAFGGIHIDGNYLYTTVDGDMNEDQNYTHEVIKFDLTTNQIVDFISLTPIVGSVRDLSYMKYAGGKLFVSLNSYYSPMVIDITGEKMALVEGGIGLENSHLARMSDVVDSKVYFFYNKQLRAYDVTTKKLADFAMDVSQVLLSKGAVATVDEHNVIVAPKNMSDGTVDLYIYDLEDKKEIIREDIFAGQSTGSPIISFAPGNAGQYIFTGAFGSNVTSMYDVLTKENTLLPGYGHQNDSLAWYQDTLWIGNYNDATIIRYDVENQKAEPLMHLMRSVFQQRRMLGGLATGDNKVFCGTTPDTGVIGGALTWYDIDRDRVYVATGRYNDSGEWEIVTYYTEDTLAGLTKVPSDETYTWYDAKTDALMDFDDDDDGEDDFYRKNADGSYQTNSDGSLVQRFTGFIYNQCVNCVVYQDGFIIGTTTKTNASGVAASTDDVVLFVYDLSQMKITYRSDLSSLVDKTWASSLHVINVVEADPYEHGKFWGVASNVLFSFNLDTKTGTITDLTNEIMAEGVAVNDVWKTGSARGHASIAFDGEYMYVPIYGIGTCMVNTEDTGDYTVLTKTLMQQHALGADGNLYFINKHCSATDLLMLPVEGYTQHLVVQSVQDVISALDSQDPDLAAVKTARAMYNDLTKTAQNMVDPANLIAAEKGFTVLLSNGNSQVYYADIEEALAAATSGAVVSLQSNASTALDLMVFSGITLDLNGYKLEAGSLFGEPGSRVIDSSENGAGVLDAELESLSASNPQLPLYDSARGGYRFFTGSMKALGVREGDNDNAQFWFRMEFANPEAYRLLANGDSGITVGGSLLVGEDTTFTVQFQNNTVKTYGQKQVNAANGQIAGIYLNVTSISAADGDAITLIPYATSGGVTVTISDEDIETMTKKAEMKWEQGAEFWDEV